MKLYTFLSWEFMTSEISLVNTYIPLSADDVTVGLRRHDTHVTVIVTVTGFYDTEWLIWYFSSFQREFENKNIEDLYQSYWLRLQRGLLLRLCTVLIIAGLFLLILFNALHVNAVSTTSGWRELTSILAWISNHTPSKMRNEIIYPFANYVAPLKLGNG